MLKNLRLLACFLICSVAVFGMTTSPALADPGRVLMLAASNAETHPQNLGAAKFADIVAKKTDGRIQIKIFHNGVLGSDLKNISAMQGGTIDMIIGSVNLLSGVDKGFGVFEFPFLFKNAAEADYVLDGPVGKELFDRLPAHGLVGLAYYELGFRHFQTRKGKPIQMADDFIGKKLRVQPSAVYIDVVHSFGANPLPMNIGEVYTAMESGAIDGMSNPLINVLDQKFYEICPYLTITNHIYQPSWLGMSKKTWDSFAPSDQQIIQAAAIESRSFHRQVSREADRGALEKLKAKGLKVTVLAPSELAKLREKAKPVIAKHTQVIGPEFVGRVYAEIERYRKSNRL